MHLYHSIYIVNREAFLFDARVSPLPTSSLTPFRGSATSYICNMVMFLSLLISVYHRLPGRIKPLKKLQPEWCWCAGNSCWHVRRVEKDGQDCSSSRVPELEWVQEASFPLFHDRVNFQIFIVERRIVYDVCHWRQLWLTYVWKLGVPWSFLWLKRCFCPLLLQFKSQIFTHFPLFFVLHYKLTVWFAHL